MNLEQLDAIVNGGGVRIEAEGKEREIVLR